MLMDEFYYAYQYRAKYTYNMPIIHLGYVTAHQGNKSV